MNKLTLFISALFFVILNVSQVWALPNCVGQRSSAWQNCFGTFTVSNGNKYVGEFGDDEFHGQGTFTWESGSKYVGEWKNDKRNGQGTFTFASGSKQVGGWENGELNGYAITYKSDGSVYQEGIFKDDVFQYAQKKSKLDEHKDTCKEIGFIPKTESFGNCVLKLMDKD